MAAKPWPQLHTAVLRQLWRTHSAAEISTFLKAIGGDYSRNAVLGKVRRLHQAEAPRPVTVPGYITLPLGHYWEPRRRHLWHHRPPDEPPRTNGRGQYELDLYRQSQGK